MTVVAQELAIHGAIALGREVLRSPPPSEFFVEVPSSVVLRWAHGRSNAISCIRFPKRVATEVRVAPVEPGAPP